MDGWNLEHHLQKSKTEKSLQNFKFQVNLFSLFRKVTFSCSLFMEKNSSRKSGKMGENAKNRENLKKHRRFFDFRQIFQSFRKSYVLVPSHGKRKWRRKSGKKTQRKGFREIVEKTYKKSEFWGEKDTVIQEFPGFPNLKKILFLKLCPTKCGDLIE